MLQIILSIWIPIKILHSVIAAKGQLTLQGVKLGYFTVKEPLAQTSLDQNWVCKFPEDTSWDAHGSFWSSELSQLPPQATVICFNLSQLHRFPLNEITYFYNQMTTTGKIKLRFKIQTLQELIMISPDPQRYETPALSLTPVYMLGWK